MHEHNTTFAQGRSQTLNLGGVGEEHFLILVSFSAMLYHGFFIFLLNLVLRVGGLPTREGPSYAAAYAYTCCPLTWQVEQNPGGRGRGREWATLGVHPLSWLPSNNRLEKVPFVSVPHTSSNRLLLSNQYKGCTPSVAHSLALPLGPALLSLWVLFKYTHMYSKLLKRHWTTSASSPIFFLKIEIFLPLEGYTYVMIACSFLLATSIQLQRYKDFSFIGHFKKSTSKNTNTVAYGTLWGWC